MNKTQLHWSSIAMYTKCGEMFRRRYVCGEILKPGIALITGRGMHRSVEVDLTRKIETGELAQEEELKDIARDYVKNEFDQQNYWIPEDEEKDTDINAERDKSIDTAISCASIHHNELAPLINPNQIERKWVIDINGFPVSLAGTIDCDEGDIIDDWKTSAKTPSATTADESPQITMYSIAKYIIDKQIPKSRLGFVIKTKTPKTVFLETTRTKDDFTPMLRVIERVSEAIEKEVYTFASAMSPRPWWCSRKFCGFFSSCPGVCGRISVLF